MEGTVHTVQRMEKYEGHTNIWLTLRKTSDEYFKHHKEVIRCTVSVLIQPNDDNQNEYDKTRQGRQNDGNDNDSDGSGGGGNICGKTGLNCPVHRV